MVYQSYSLSHIVQVVTAPMSSVNAIAVEAYKKYVLVSLILHGQVCHFILFTFFLIFELLALGSYETVWSYQVTIWML